MRAYRHVAKLGNELAVPFVLGDYGHLVLALVRLLRDLAVPRDALYDVAGEERCAETVPEH